MEIVSMVAVLAPFFVAIVNDRFSKDLISW
jgi:hypothetical protein